MRVVMVVIAVIGLTVSLFFVWLSWTKPVYQPITRGYVVLGGPQLTEVQDAS